ncbi:hypothetical protein MK805_08005 [Shimazuella sp. AN120528]|uniref:hypothetical protein n=1 Tax=Shimazuella soli TaxID=1892854 RepID=UPI001F0F10BA|nr:hypothetical protein [Shimazuella soli]MCH5584915.1 hypothetical protein [Shimazuella soli]
MQIFQIGREIARLVVAYGEGKQLISLIRQFQQAKTRNLLIEVIYQLIYLGEAVKVHQKRLQVSPIKWEALIRFIEKGSISDVRKLHTSMIESMARLQVDKVLKLEKHLEELKRK